MPRQKTLSSLSLAILGIVSLEPVSGYGIRKIFCTTPMGHFSTSPGAIYPALKRLKENSLIKGQIVKKNSLRPKQIYALTHKGLETLKEMLVQPVTHQDIIWRLEEMILRFTFIGNLLGKEQSLRFLNELAFCIEEYVPTLQENINIQRKLKNINGAFAVEQGLAKYRTTARWARRVIRELENE